MTAAEDPWATSAAEDEGAPTESGRGSSSPPAPGTLVGAASLREPLERLAAALGQLERLAAVEEQLLRESLRVTREAAAALGTLAAPTRLRRGPESEAEPE